jgi:hypothetical protein
MPTSVSTDPIVNSVYHRPHILSHLVGASAIGRDRADARARRKEERHASISYGTPATPIQDVPASVVYGRSWAWWK